MSNQATPKTMKPRLRFPEFRKEPGWNAEKLGTIASLTTERAEDKKCIPMSITSGVGLVSQQEKFGRTIAGNQYKNYLVLQKNDFAYNKSATKDFPQGFIAMYSGDEPAAVPNSIFTCFRTYKDGVVPEFLNYLFLGNLHGKWVKKYIEVSARAHGSLSIDDDILLSLPVPLPSGKSSLAEQRKIAECLTSLDEVIAGHGQKLAALQSHKKGLLQQLFPSPGETRPRLRFPKFQNAGEWNELTLSNACRMKAGQFVAASDIKEQPAEGLYPCYGGNGLRGYVPTFTHEGTYSLIGRQGALCGNVKLCTGRFHATEHAVVATPEKGIDVGWLYYALDLLNLNRFATGQAQPGLSVDNLEKVALTIPEQEGEQHRIAMCLSSLDDLIAAQTQKLEVLKTHKQGLMQQLFPATAEAADL